VAWSDEDVVVFALPLRRVVRDRVWLSPALDKSNKQIAAAMKRRCIFSSGRHLNCGADTILLDKLLKFNPPATAGGSDANATANSESRTLGPR